LHFFYTITSLLYFMKIFSLLFFLRVSFRAFSVIIAIIYDALMMAQRGRNM
jgi:hypothetical protein